MKLLILLSSRFMSKIPSLCLGALGAICLVILTSCAAPKNGGEKNRAARSELGRTENRSDYWPRPDPDQALRNAKSVVLVKRVVQGDQVHSFLKEVWRSKSGAQTLPPIGTDYGSPFPYDSRMRLPERDAIIFEFGADRPTGLPTTWILLVNDAGRVSPFEKPSYERQGLRGAGDTDNIPVLSGEAMTVDELRQAVRDAKVKPD